MMKPNQVQSISIIMTIHDPVSLKMECLAVFSNILEAIGSVVCQVKYCTSTWVSQSRDSFTVILG